MCTIFFTYESGFEKKWNFACNNFAKVSATSNEEDESLTRGRLGEACALAGHDEATEAFWLITSKLLGGKSSDYDEKVVADEATPTR